MNLEKSGSEEEPILTAMIVDDSEIDRMICQRAIRRSGLFQRVLTFSDGEAALDFLTRNEPPKIDLILLDLNMPRIGGLEFMEKISCALDPPPTVLMLTVTPPQQIMARLQELSCLQDTICKPITEGELRRIFTTRKRRNFRKIS